MTFDWTVKIGDVAIVFATIMGPILAVQAQKWIERVREDENRRIQVFYALMATRQARLSFEHVRALNSIDLAFYGRKVFGKVLRKDSFQGVLDAWHDYHSLLSTPIEQRPQNDAEQREWTGRGDELFTNLLDKHAAATNFKYDRNQLKTGSYSPEAHWTLELEQQALRRLAFEVLSGNKTLPMEVKSWPVDPEAVAQQKNMQEQLVENQKITLARLVEILGLLVDKCENRSVFNQIKPD